MLLAQNLHSFLPHLSMLEKTSVKFTTIVDYVSRIVGFIEFCQAFNHDWESPEQMDSILVLYLDYLFMLHYCGEDGNKLVAALKFVFPCLSRLGAFGLPRSSRSVKSWMSKIPSHQRLPFPWLALCAVMGYLIHHDHVPAAIMLLIQFRTYLRPGVFDRLLVCQLIPPVPEAPHPYNVWGLTIYPADLLIPGKTGTWDDAVLLDTELWLAPFLMMLIAHRAPDILLWPISGPKLVTLFFEAVENLGMAALNPVRYSLRHGGASDDIISHRRTLLAVKRRGQWRTDQSLRRYAKETKVTTELHKLPPETLKYAKYVQNHLESIFHQTVPNQPPMFADVKRLRSK